MVAWGGPRTAGVADSIVELSANDAGERGIFATISDQLGPTVAPEREIPGSPQRTCAGTTRRLVVPGHEVTVTDVALDAEYPVTAPTELPDGEFLVTSRSRGAPSAESDPATVYVRFDGPASVKPEDGAVVVSFWELSAVTVGHESTGCSSPPRLTVEPSPPAVARALTHLAAAHQTTGPARSHPGFRDHPPLITLGDETTVPPAVRDATPDPTVELRVPDSFEALFVAAPLAYYLGARVVVSDVDSPKLVGPGAEHRFDPLPGFQHQCAQLLRRVFYLDCQVRRVASGSDETSGRLCADFGLDPDEVRTLSPGERLCRYLSVPARELDATLPDWHLSTYVAPEPRHVRCLPALLDRVSLVYLPQASTLERSTLLDRTLSDAFPTRGAGSPAAGVVEPTLQAGRVHAWLAPGTPIDAFKMTPAALENQFRSSIPERDRMRVTVVLNDESMGDEHGAVAEIYRECAANLPIDVTVRDRLLRAALADVFETDTDFVHYIGHCDDGGLRCPDGNLDVTDVERARTRTFFLNACGSYQQGEALIRRGSIAGAVTFRTVLDRQAARVGTAFARLLVHGFSFERALSLARRRILMGKDYTVVGDGTYALLPGPKQPGVVRIAGAPGGGYEVRCEVVDARTNGARYRTPFSHVPALNGTTTERRMSADELTEALEGTSMPVVYQGDVRWSDDVVNELPP